MSIKWVWLITNGSGLGKKLGVVLLKKSQPRVGVVVCKVYLKVQPRVGVVGCGLFKVYLNCNQEWVWLIKSGCGLYKAGVVYLEKSRARFAHSHFFFH